LDFLSSLYAGLRVGKFSEYGEGCSSGAGCSDDSACNSGDNTDCIYPDANYDCCGVCNVETDCLGVCGGSATDEECSESSNNCPTCTIVCPPEDDDCDGDFTNIQNAIEFTAEGDTILVEPGIYYENIVIQKNITLASRAIFDDMSDWVGYSDEYFINNENINGTILNGSADTNGEGFESVLLIGSLDDCIEPLIFGFTITGGEGTRVMVEVEGGENGREEVEQIRGGGFLAVNALPMFKHNAIIQNKGNTTPIHSGGGGDQTSGVDIPTHPDFNWDSPRTECNGDLDLSFNFYKDNDATYGNTFSSVGIEGSIDMSSSIFDVYNCPEEEVTTVWVDVDEDVDVDFDNGVGDLCSITDDVWVSPGGGDNNLGTSESQAFLTIGRALEMIAPEDGDAITINLTEGIFSPITGEEFPIVMISNVNLIGQGEEVTIIDAEQTNRVITMDNCDNNTISGITITGGDAPPNYGDHGGGMHLSYSNPTLTHVTISNNTAEGVSGKGGGMYLYSSNPTLTHATISNNTADYGGGMHMDFSDPSLTNVTISGNTADDDYSKGGGMYLYYSNPSLTNVTISGNTADYGGGINLDGYSDPTLNHVTISNNTADYGGGMKLYYSNPSLTNVTISGNTAEYSGGGMYSYSSNPNLTHVTISNNSGGGMYCQYNTCNTILTNSIIWGNSPESISFNEEPVITYSDIEGGWEGEGNIDSDPLFTYPEYGDYTLIETSPCIDTGDPNLWYQDLDGTRADMGATGGLYATPNFTSHDFGEVGDFGSSKQFTLYNFRETPITISDAYFATSSFTTNAKFPMTIVPLETGIISIDANNAAFGYMEDAMELISDDLPDGLSVSLSVTGSEGNILTGNLSGSYEAATYRITGDLTIADGDTAYIHAGTEFLFDGQYNFTIYGMLQAIGTENDIIIFDSFSDERWRGFTLDNASDQTTFEYVRISGATKDDGGGMYLNSSNPSLTNVTIVNNTAGDFGGGMYLLASNPTLTHVTISNNTAEGGRGGGMYLYSSNPNLTHVTILNNSGRGMWLDNSNPTLINSIIWGNSPENIRLWTGNEEPVITYSDIEGGWEGEGNIDVDPLFNEDFTLMDASPCIDAGTADLDGDGIDDITQYYGVAPDMGAFEFCAYFDECGVCDGDNSTCLDCAGVPNGGAVVDECDVCDGDGSSCGLSGDLNSDGLINVLDVVVLVNIVLGYGDPVDAGDMNGDGILNVLDVVALVNIILGGG